MTLTEHSGHFVGFSTWPKGTSAVKLSWIVMGQIQMDYITVTTNASMKDGG